MAEEGTSVEMMARMEFGLAGWVVRDEGLGGEG
jgi:hypothetical protein